MARAAVEADLILEHGPFRYVIESDDLRVFIRANVRAMLGLRRQFAGQSPLRPLLTGMFLLSHQMNLFLKWRWGPFGLTLVGPGGPTRPARWLGLGRRTATLR